MEIKEKQEELRKSAKPLVEYIRKNCDPMTTIIVTCSGAEEVSTDMHVPFNDEWD